MIEIVERPSRKISGITSLFLIFQHNELIETNIKASGVNYYDKITHEWECPLFALSFLLDKLTYIDAINLVLYKERTTKQPLVQPILQHKTKPFSYQIEGITYGLNHNNWLLLDAPGLGKSLECIYLAEELKVQKGIEHCLVVCGINTLKTNWKKEILKHSSLDCIIIGEKFNKQGKLLSTTASIKERIEQLDHPIKEFFIIVNVESLRDNKIIEAFNKGPNKIGMIVVDEIHKCKGWNSQQGKNLLELEAPYKVGATGTMLMNSPLDAYVPLVFIGQEAKRSITRYKETYCVFDNLTKGQIIGFKNLDLLKEEIEACSLRRTQTLVELPPKNVIDEYVDMDKTQKEFYDAIQNGVKEEADKVKLKVNNLLAMITRLRQASTCPSVLTSKLITNNKVERAISLIEEIVSNGDKVLVFSNFKEPIYILEERLKQYHPLLGTGDMQDEEVSKNIDKFQTDALSKVFLGTISKMGTGVTLTSASYLIFLDQPWTEALYTQACYRIYRIGQTKPVFIYNLIATNTIDVVVSRIIQRKKAISDYVIDDVQDPETIKILQQYIEDL